MDTGFRECRDDNFPRGDQNPLRDTFVASSVRDDKPLQNPPEAPEIGIEPEPDHENGQADPVSISPDAAVQTPSGFSSLGLAARHEGNNKLAAEHFGQAVAGDPGNADYHWLLAAAEFARGQIEPAANAYREAVRLQPDHAPYHNDLGVVLARLGHRDEAAACFREAIRLQPDFPDAHNNLGNYFRLAGRHDAAVACFREALRLRPAYAEAYNNLAIALKHQGKPAEAVAAYQEALRLKPAYPEAHHNLGILVASTGRHDAAVACFQQAIRLRPDYAEAYANLAGALSDLQRLPEAEATYREAVRLRTDDARAHKNLGIALARQDKLDAAIACYLEALRLKPDYADAHNDLGIALARRNRFEEAEASYRRALEHRPDYAEALNNRGNTLRNLGRFDEALASFDRALALKPNYVDAYNNRGITFAEQGRFDEAAASYTSCIKLRPTHADAHLNRALTWLRQGNFAQGWAEYEWRLRKKGALSRPPVQPAWNGYPPEGLRVLIVHEQGLGDSLHFIRYASLLKRLGATVIYEGPEKLFKILARTPGIDAFHPQGKEPPEHDVFAALLSLPGLMGTRVESVPVEVPYIHPDPDLVERWRGELAAYPGFKVGINWQGNPGYGGDFHRSVPLRHYAPLARLPGVRLFSLQKNEGADQLKGFGEGPVIELGSRLDGATGAFMDTAAVLKNLDLFITSDTSVAHLAGALGVPVWVPLSAAPGWPWMWGREDSPWYPTMRLFRQEKLGDWPPVFERMARELSKLVPAAHRPRSVGVRVSPGELFERIAALEIAAEQAADEPAREEAQAQLAALEPTRDGLVSPSAESQALAAEMKDAMRALKAAEAAMRECERSGDFGPGFVEQARAMASARDRVAALRMRVDALLDAGEGPADTPPPV
jgi:tetratricopeptide (TPR) repeat protein